PPVTRRILSRRRPMLPFVCKDACLFGRRPCSTLSDKQNQRVRHLMSDVKVQFLFDFGSPNAYLSHQVIPAIEQRTGVTFEYVPILLGGLFRLTGNRSPAEAFAGIKNKLEYARLEMDRFVKKHGLSAYRFNPPFPVNTLQIMRGAVAARL